MGKKQKSISVPLETWNELEEIYRQYKDELKIMEVTSASELLRVLANLGKPRLPEIIEALRKSRMKTAENQKKQ